LIALLERMGDGRAGSVQRTSASGVAGVDGIISQDPLGLDRIYDGHAHATIILIRMMVGVRMMA